MKKKEICYCSVCGVSSEIKRVVKNKAYGDYLCEKHRNQYKNYGKFLDSSPRGVFDPNEVRTYENYAEIDTYDSHGNVVSTFLLDLEDVEKLGTKKWRTIFKLDKPYLFTGNQKSERIYFHRLIMNPSETQQVDHISGNTLDNRKSNLRLASIQENMCNLKKRKNNTSGVRGVSFNKRRNKWIVDFTYKKERFYVKPFDSLEEAVYLRYLLEKHFNSELRNTSNDEIIFSHINKLTKLQKKEIENYMLEKLNTSKDGV